MLLKSQHMRLPSTPCRPGKCIWASWTQAEYFRSTKQVRATWPQLLLYPPSLNQTCSTGLSSSCALTCNFYINLQDLLNLIKYGIFIKGYWKKKTTKQLPCRKSWKFVVSPPGMPELLLQARQELLKWLLVGKILVVFWKQDQLLWVFTPNRY